MVEKQDTGLVSKKAAMRKARLEEALRDNLKRRKQQARAQKQAGKPAPRAR